jgi:hypothetical protein
VRCIGITGIFAALVTVSASAEDAERPCVGLAEERGKADQPLTQSEQPLMTANECEALKRRELHMRLLEIPQEEEDPMGLSLGSKDKGGMLYFKIPFSF